MAEAASDKTPWNTLTHRLQKDNDSSRSDRSYSKGIILRKPDGPHYLSGEQEVAAAAINHQLKACAVHDAGQAGDHDASRQQERRPRGWGEAQ